ncbi:MAG TPA: DNA double-strand break repair nuclease NurA [Candidatus Nanoarchaeia archaeon]|nr:DNA double-strand break repair nuclease NurA [Candidatus Nanoarchaeia archaeon]
MEALNEIAEALKLLEQKRAFLSECFKQTDKDGITKFKFPINPVDLHNLKICGVDGGLLKKEYHGAGLILRRAVAVCFTYSEGKLSETRYFPDRKPMPEPIAVGPEFSEADFNLLASLKREEVELKTCLKAIGEFEPNVLVRDGSIVLYPSNLPEKTSQVYKVYQSVVKLVRELYKTCQEKNILLVGAVEDSRGKRYCNIILQEAVPALLKANINIELLRRIDANKDVLNNTTDTLFLYNLLSTGERTAALDYSKTSELPILKDLEEFSKKLFVVYIKAAEFDRPLRLDFLSDVEKLDETADKIAAIIYEISKLNRMYSYPSILIEADGRAKLEENDIFHFKAALAEKLGNNPALFELRRDLRPF